MGNGCYRLAAGSALMLIAAVTMAVAQAPKPAVVLHDLAGRDNCLMCHRPGAMEMVTDAPANHAGRESVTCLWCHGSDARVRTVDPPTFAHDLAGRDNCLMCHAPGAMEPVPDTPQDHGGRESKHCLMCHRRSAQ